MTAWRRVVPLPPLLVLGIFALFLVLSPSDTAQAQTTGNYNGPSPEPPPEHRVPVDWPLIPSGLGPGDSFRLLFLTSTKGDATSGDLTTYQFRVHNLINTNGHSAIQPYAADFRPVISIENNPEINARAVISYYLEYGNGPGRDMPVYWVNGGKVADDSADFFDNSWDSHVARNEQGWVVQGSLEDKRAWTGSSQRGTRNYAVGHSSGRPRTGILQNKDELEHDRRVNSEQYRLYVMSPVFTVDRTRARATYGLVEDPNNSCHVDIYNPRYLSGPSVVYRGPRTTTRSPTTPNGYGGSLALTVYMKAEASPAMWGWCRARAR